MKSFGRKMLVPTTGYIYFVQMAAPLGPIKIGFTKKIKQRIISMKTNSPYKLELLCLFPGNESMEAELHRCYRDVRLEGEWFLPHPRILQDIKHELETNKQNGFITPVPEYDFKESGFDRDPYDVVLEEDESLDWKFWHQSENYQQFKKSDSIEERQMLIKAYIVYYDEDGKCHKKY